MSEEKALELFARCYNRCDFTEFARRLSKRAVYEAFNRFYRHNGRESVRRLLEEKAAELRSMPLPNKAWRGYLMSTHDLMDLPKCDRCVILTASDPRRVLGIVRIKAWVFGIREIVVMDPVKCQFTRGDYCGERKDA